MTLFDLDSLPGPKLYPVESVANKFLELAAQSGRALTHMQLQKLVYIAHGFSFPLLGQPLTFNTFEAWKHGPVCPHLYDLLKDYGSKAITIPLFVNNNSPVLSEEAVDLIEAIWRGYGRFSAAKLREITHMSGTPWDKTDLQDVISDEVTREYYFNLVQRNVRAK